MMLIGWMPATLKWVDLPAFFSHSQEMFLLFFFLFVIPPQTRLPFLIDLITKGHGIPKYPSGTIVTSAAGLYRRYLF